MVSLGLAHTKKLNILYYLPQSDGETDGTIDIDQSSGEPDYYLDLREELTNSHQAPEIF